LKHRLHHRSDYLIFASSETRTSRFTLSHIIHNLIMAWYQKILLSSILAVIVCWSAPVYGYDCPYVICTGNTYCCGYDVCCFDYTSIWYVWLVFFLLFLSICSCCLYRWKNRSANQIIVANPTVFEETSAVIVNRHPHPSQYGAFGTAQQPYYWQYQQQYTDNPPMYQPAGYAPVEKTPSAP